MITALIFILFLCPLIFFHELGHFLFAKYYGVRVETFSIGFGPKILKYKRGDTTYAISLIPLGGYVKMFGDNILEKDNIPKHERDQAFTHKTKWQRFWIVLGGPLANFILAFVLFWFLLIGGETVPEPRIGVVFPPSQFYQLGFRTGDLLQKINGRPILSTLDFVTLDEDDISVISILRENQEFHLSVDMTKEETLKAMAALPPALRAPLVVDRHQQVWGLTLDPKKVDENIPLVQLSPDKTSELYLVRAKTFTREKRVFDYSIVKTIRVDSGVDRFLSSLIEQYYWPVDLMVKGITKDSAAEEIGIESQDIIVGLNKKSVIHFQQIIDHVSQMKKGESVQLQIYRKGKLRELEVTPKRKKVDGKTRNMIGVYTSMVFSLPKMIQTPAHGFFDSIGKALARTKETTVATFMMFKKLIVGSVPLKSVGGPIAIAKVASESFAISLSHFLKIMAAISINLGIVNLFPIPVLDGGHILFLIIETINRRPVSRRIVEASLKFGVSILFFLIFLALYNDIIRFMN